MTTSYYNRPTHLLTDDEQIDALTHARIVEAFDGFTVPTDATGAPLVLLGAMRVERGQRVAWVAIDPADGSQMVLGSSTADEATIDGDGITVPEGWIVAERVLDAIEDAVALYDNRTEEH